MEKISSEVLVKVLRKQTSQIHVSISHFSISWVERSWRNYVCGVEESWPDPRSAETGQAGNPEKIDENPSFQEEAVANMQRSNILSWGWE